MPENNFFKSKIRGTSQFWQGLHKVKHLFKWGAVFRAKKGDNIRFWEDAWAGRVPLKIQYPDLYKICDDQDALVSDCFDEGDWEIGFRRSLTCGDAEQFQTLLNILRDIRLDASAHDELEWVLDKSKSFTTKSLYRFMTHRGVVIANSQSIWNTKLPLKIKIFLWQLSNNKLQAAVS
jgi:hypothetical protein